MEIHTAEFIQSSTSLASCPAPELPEYAFIGRSNVGKSSLINMLTARNGLAKTSSSPGKTQCINHFLINKGKQPWFLVDLPGYGYAKVPQTERKKWQQFIRSYLSKRETLMCVFVLVDVRHSAQSIDLEFMEWLGTEGIPFVIAFTKADKLSPTALQKSIQAFQDEMLKEWEELPPVFITSAETKAGREELLHFVSETNDLY